MPFALNVTCLKIRSIRWRRKCHEP